MEWIEAFGNWGKAIEAIGKSLYGHPLYVVIALAILASAWIFLSPTDILSKAYGTGFIFVFIMIALAAYIMSISKHWNTKKTK
jgi:hypothetical protein